MLRGRDFQHAVNKTIEYGGKAMTAYNIGKAAYTAGRFILPLLIYRQRRNAAPRYGAARAPSH